MSASDAEAVAEVPKRAACPTCKAVFRGDFRRCSNCGTQLILGGPDPLVGTVLAERYQIEDVIGDGGLGRVYRARHVRMSRRYAIKVPFGDVGYDRKSRARLANEAEAASRLDHPNVIGIVDVGETSEGLFYLAMDLAQGESLADALADGPLPAADALDYLIQICAGLAHAHDRGLIHRDLKPDNIVVSVASDGQPLIQIIDFGLAMIADAEGSRLTTDGLVVGTPYYMAPEQSTDEPLDNRTDLFALGIILYEMLAGNLPFEGTPTSVARQNLAVELPTVFERSGRTIDPMLDGLIGWMTRKRQQERPDSARVVGEVARLLAAGDRAAARALLPESLRPPLPAAPPTVAHRLTPDEAFVGSAPTLAQPKSQPVAASRPPTEPPASRDTSPGATALAADQLRLSTRSDRAVRNPLRRYALVAVAGLGLGAAVFVGVRAMTRHGGGPAAVVVDAALPVAVVPDAAAPIITSIDAAPVAVDAAPAIDAGVSAVHEERRDARLPPARADARTAIEPGPPIDAAARPLAIDAAPPRPLAIDAGTPEPPTTSLKALYGQVTDAFNAAAARHSAAEMQPLRSRLDNLTPYGAAVRNQALRAQAEQELRALLHDLSRL